MLKKLYSSFMLVALLAGATLVAVARPAPRDLLAQLPPSDVVVSCDLQRLQSQTIPTFGAIKPQMMADLNREIEKFQRESGIDPRTFDSAAIGVRLKGANPEWGVVLLQGRFNAADVIEKGFAAVVKDNPKVRREERQYEGFTIFLSKTGGTPPKDETRRDAVMALDSNTVVIGDYGAVQAVINTRLGRGGRVDDEVLNLVTRTPDALVSVGGIVPPGLAQDIIGKDSDRFGSLAGSIRRFAGALNTVGLEVDANLSLFTETAEQANDLTSALNGFRLLFTGFHAGGAAQKNGPDPLRKLVNDLQISAQNNEVQLRLNVREDDVRLLLNAF